MSGRKSRRKGLRNERLIVYQLQDAGLAAERIPLSGAAGGRYSGDVSVPVLGVDRKIEVKARADGFSLLYRWLEGNYGLVVRRDRDAPLLIIRLADAIEIAKIAESTRKECQP